MIRWQVGNDHALQTLPDEGFLGLGLIKFVGVKLVSLSIVGVRGCAYKNHHFAYGKDPTIPNFNPIGHGAFQCQCYVSSIHFLIQHDCFTTMYGPSDPTQVANLLGRRLMSDQKCRQPLAVLNKATPGQTISRNPSIKQIEQLWITVVTGGWLIWGPCRTFPCKVWTSSCPSSLHIFWWGRQGKFCSSMVSARWFAGKR